MPHSHPYLLLQTLSYVLSFDGEHISCYDQVYFHFYLMIKVAAGSLNRKYLKYNHYCIQNLLYREPGPGQQSFVLGDLCQSQPCVQLGSFFTGSSNDSHHQKGSLFIYFGDLGIGYRNRDQSRR